MNLGTYAGDVIKQLQDWGYNVMLNGLIGTSPIWMKPIRGIARCWPIHPVMSEPLKADEWQTVYVDLSCPGNPSGTTPCSP